MKFSLLLIFAFLFCLFSAVAADEQAEPFRVRDRMLEVGFAGINYGFSNNFIGVFGLLPQGVVDIDNVNNDLSVKSNTLFMPRYFSYRRDNIWGIGFSTTFEAFGFANVPESLLSLGEARNDTSVIRAAAFTGINAFGFFHIQNLKVRLGTSLLQPIGFVIANAYYTNYTGGDKAEMGLSYFLRVYTMGPLENSTGGISSLPGVDFSIGFEYPLSGSFTAGLDIANIPFIPSILGSYMELVGFASINELEDFDDFGNFLESNSGGIIHGASNRRLFRPFKMLAWADWRPLESELLSVIPSFGFAVNALYVQPVSAEGGFIVRLNFSNLFIPSIGVSYTDRLWKNSLDLILNFRFFELNFGLDMRAENFVQSWQGYAFGVRVGFKLGW